MRRLSGRQLGGVAILLLLALYFHAVMPLWEFIVVLLLVGIPAGVAAGVSMLFRGKREHGGRSRDRGAR